MLSSKHYYTSIEGFLFRTKHRMYFLPRISSNPVRGKKDDLWLMLWTILSTPSVSSSHSFSETQAACDVVSSAARAGFHLTRSQHVASEVSNGGQDVTERTLLPRPPPGLCWTTGPRSPGTCGRRNNVAQSQRATWECGGLPLSATQMSFGQSL